MSGSGISLSLQLGGGRAATSSGRLPALSGGGSWNGNNYSILLDGTDDVITLGNSSDLAPANLTIMCWFKASGSVETYNYLISRAGALYGSYFLRYRSNNKFNYFLDFGSGQFVQGDSSSTYTLTDWHHIALTYDQSFVKLYVDGAEANSQAETRAIDYTPNSVGRGYDNTLIGNAALAHPAEGLIDEVAFFNTALSASQITNIYRGETNGGSGGTNGLPGDLSTFNPVGWYRMGDNDGGSGTTITDQGSGGNNGSLDNGPTFSSTVPS
jgi:hypothetical protein